MNAQLVIHKPVANVRHGHTRKIISGFIKCSIVRNEIFLCNLLKGDLSEELLLIETEIS